MGSLIKLLDRPIAYQPSFAQLRVGKIKTGPVGAVLLSQFVYWHNRMDGRWFYKTRQEITQETGLSRDEQETGRKRLVAVGVLEEQLRGAPATMHYRVNADRLEALLLALAQEESQLVETPPTRLRKPRQLVGGNAPNKMVEPPPTSRGEPCQLAGGNPANSLTGDYTETTQEITQEIYCQADELPDEPHDDESDPVLRVLNHFNRVTNSEFRDGATTRGFISGVLQGEYVADDLMLVVDYIANEWAGQDNMSFYLRPKTIFSQENFEGYFDQARAWRRNGKPQKIAEPAKVNIDLKNQDYSGIPKGFRS
ncbi:hypothetical protein M988_2014 [Hafnia paralvei ATCC 29927]|nr:hypothetical protein M988_2014 [Hafnia paralvei ATCC 29927]